MLVTRAGQELAFQNLPEPCPPFNPDRASPCQFMLRLKDFPPDLSDAVVIASTASVDVGLVTRSKVPLTHDVDSSDQIANVFTTTAMADDSRRAQLPMSEGMTEGSSDTSPIGVALDLSSKDKVSRPLPKEEYTESPGPLPGLMILNNEGTLTAWWLVYAGSIRQGTIYPGLAVAGGHPTTQQLQTQQQTPSFPSLSAPQNTAGSSQPAFGQAASPFGNALNKPAAPAFGSSGNSMFGSSSALGRGSSPWATQTSSAPASAANAPSFGSPAFGSTSSMGTQAQGSSFGVAGGLNNRSSPWGTGGGTTQPSAAFGQASSLGQQSSPFGVGTAPSTQQSTQANAFASFAAKPSGFAASGIPSTGSVLRSASSSNTFASPTTTSSPFTQQKPDQNNNTNSTFGQGGFNLGSTFKTDGTDVNDAAKPPSTSANSMFGSGFGETLSQAREEPTQPKDADMDDDMDQDQPQEAKTPVNVPAKESQSTTDSSLPSSFKTVPPAAGGLFGTQAQSAVSPANVQSNQPAQSQPDQSATAGSASKELPRSAKDLPPVQTSPKIKAEPDSSDDNISPLNEEELQPPEGFGGDDESTVRQHAETQSPNISKPRSAEPPVPPESTSKSSFAPGESSNSSKSSPEAQQEITTPSESTPSQDKQNVIEPTLAEQNEPSKDSPREGIERDDRKEDVGEDLKEDQRGDQKEDQKEVQKEDQEEAQKEAQEEDLGENQEEPKIVDREADHKADSAADLGVNQKADQKEDQTEDQKADQKEDQAEVQKADHEANLEAEEKQEQKEEQEVVQGEQREKRQEAEAIRGESDEQDKEQGDKVIEESEEGDGDEGEEEEEDEEEEDGKLDAEDGEVEEEVEGDDEGSGVDVAHEMSSPSDTNQTNQSPKISPESSFGAPKSPIGGLFSKVELKDTAARQTPLFGEVGNQPMPIFALPNKTQESPRSPSPVRRGQISRLTADSPRPDNSRSMSAPGTYRNVINRKIAMSQISVPPNQTQPSPAELRREEEQRVALERARRKAEEEQTLDEDDGEEVIRSELAAEVPAKKSLDPFLAHQDYVGNIDKPGIPGQIEKVYRDINSMVDTIGLNARSVAAFIRGHTELISEEGRSIDDLDHPDQWCLEELPELASIEAGLAEDLEAHGSRDMQNLLETCREIRSRVLPLDERRSDLTKAIEKRKDTQNAQNARSAPLSFEQTSQQQDVRKKFLHLQNLLGSAEKDLNLLRAKLAACDSNSPQQRSGSHLTSKQRQQQQQHSVKKPTAEAVTKTILKMTSMIEKKGGDIDVLEAQIRSLRLSSSSSPVSSRPQSRHSREGSPLYTRASPSPSPGKKGLGASSLLLHKSVSARNSPLRQSLLGGTPRQTLSPLRQPWADPRGGEAGNGFNYDDDGDIGQGGVEADEALRQQARERLQRRKEVNRVIRDMYEKKGPRIRTLD